MEPNQIGIFTRDLEVAHKLIFDLGIEKNVVICRGAIQTHLTLPTEDDANAFLELYLDQFPE